jgi:hypothetical protein
MCREGGGKNKNTKHSLDSFIKQGNERHNFAYDYSQITEYINNNTKVPITCPKHGLFYQRPRDHLVGNGCRECGRARTIESKRATLDEFMQRGNELHNYTYGYSYITEYKNNKTKVPITCPKHGIFYQRPCDHLFGQGCPVCRNSKGESQICSILSSMGITFEQQKKLEGCVNKKLLPFDFYIESHNLLIEYHGNQHYAPNDFFGGEEEYLLRIKNDSIKEQFATDNGYHLLVIPYWENDIEAILKQTICKKNELLNIQKFIERYNNAIAVPQVILNCPCKYKH